VGTNVAGTFSDEGQVIPAWLRDEAYRAEAARVVAQYRLLVEPLALTFGGESEALLHDFSRLPNSIVAISGTLSGREVGGPCTDLLLRDVLSDAPVRHRVGYQSTMPNGRICRSTSIYLFGTPERPVGSLCINIDVSSLVSAREVLDSLIGGAAHSPEPDERTGGERTGGERTGGESFYQTVEQAADGILEDAIRRTGVSPNMMSRKHKILLVRELEGRGFFTLRGAVGLAASTLSVSKYTIYNYLNEIGKEVDRE